MDLNFFAKNLYFFTVLISLTECVNYCHMPSCRKEHIGCDNDGKLRNECSNDDEILPIDDDLKAAILHKHNSIRNEVAGGKMEKFQPAVRMATMSWDDELAQLAELNVKQCKMNHDTCRATEKFPYAGQNIVRKGWLGDDRTIKDVVLVQVQKWANEHFCTTMDAINRYSGEVDGCWIGHFTQLVQDRATHVGCGLLRQAKKVKRKKELRDTRYQLMTCNYAITNVRQRPVYKSGPKAGSECLTGTNPKYPALCSIDEVYNVSRL